jgi:hypothetical protein
MAGSNDWVIAGCYCILNDPTTLPTALETKYAFVDVGNLLFLFYLEEMFTHMITKDLSYGHSKSYTGLAQTNS